MPYGGPALQSGTKYTWKVRAWDETDQPSAYSAPASLETGLLQQATGPRSGSARPPTTSTSAATSGSGTRTTTPSTTCRRSRATCAPRSRCPTRPQEARFLFTVDDEAIVYVNGTQVIDTKATRDADENAWQKATQLDVTSLLHQGANTIAVQVKNRLNPSGGQTPGGFIARLKAGGTTLDTSSAWKTSTTGPDGWEQPAFDDTAWTPARELATYGSGPWGANVCLPPQPSPYLRKDFSADQADPQARLYVSALGMYEVHINGAKVGDAVLAPGWTEYSKRVPSQTYDVTEPRQAG